MSELPSRLAGVCSAVLAAALLAVPGVASATGIKIYSYAVKFICENEAEGTDVDTSVNIHNPSLTGNAHIKLKLVNPEAVGEPYYWVFDEIYLARDAATSVECDRFQADEQVPAIATIDDDFEGFIVVLSTKPLDVVGVYEVEEESEGTEDVEVVPVAAQTQTVPLTVWNSLYGPN